MHIVPTRTSGSAPDAVNALSSRDVLGSSQVRAQNSAHLLRLLWSAREVSRADLARQTGLSRSTISAIVADLIDTGLVQEVRTGESRGGRKPILLAFNDDAYLLAGVDMGATHVSLVVTNLRGEVRHWEARPKAVRDDPEGTLATVHQMLAKALIDLEVKPTVLLGMGVSVPSPVDPAAPGRLLPLILPKWAGHDLVKELGDTYHLPVFVDNDANLGALAEVWWGGRDPHGDLAFIKVALGVGSGLIINGRVHRGRHGTAGEMGHTSLDPAGPRCVCGLNGCLNTLIGTKNLLQRAKSQLEVYPESQLNKRRRLTIEQLVASAIDGDRLAQEVITYAGRTLGVGVANLLNLLAPEVVVLGGGLTQAGDLLLEPLRQTVAGMSLAESVSKTTIEISKLGEQGIALGAATMALEAALDDPRLFAKGRLASA